MRYFNLFLYLKFLRKTSRKKEADLSYSYLWIKEYALFSKMYEIFVDLSYLLNFLNDCNVNEVRYDFHSSLHI